MSNDEIQLMYDDTIMPDPTDLYLYEAINEWSSVITGFNQVYIDTELAGITPVDISLPFWINGGRLSGIAPNAFENGTLNSVIINGLSNYNYEVIGANAFANNQLTSIIFNIQDIYVFAYNTIGLNAFHGNIGGEVKYIPQASDIEDPLTIGGYQFPPEWTLAFIPDEPTNIQYRYNSVVIGENFAFNVLPLKPNYNHKLRYEIDSKNELALDQVDPWGGNWILPLNILDGVVNPDGFINFILETYSVDNILIGSTTLRVKLIEKMPAIDNNLFYIIGLDGEIQRLNQEYISNELGGIEPNELYIPKIINNINVASIGVLALEGTKAQLVDIPDGVVSVGNSAFDNAWYLNSIAIPDSVTTIGQGMVYGYNLPATIYANLLPGDIVNPLTLRGYQFPDNYSLLPYDDRPRDPNEPPDLNVPTKPTFSVPFVEFGEELFINMISADPTYKHTITYEFGSLVGPIVSNLTGSFNWVVPVDLANEIPTLNESILKINAETFDIDGNLIGFDFNTIPIKVPITSKPSFTELVMEETVIKNTTGEIIQNISKPKFTIVGDVGSMGATIVKYNIRFDSKNWPTKIAVVDLVDKKGLLKAVGTITDSRGRESRKEIDVNILPYQDIEIKEMIIDRALVDGVLDIEGTYASVQGSIITNPLVNIDNIVKNNFTVNVYSRMRGEPIEQSISKYEFTSSDNLTLININEVIPGYLKDETYILYVVAKDLFTESKSNEFLIAPADVTMSWHKKGLGIGKIWDQGALDIKGDVFQQNGKIYAEHLEADKSTIRSAKFTEDVQVDQNMRIDGVLSAYDIIVDNNITFPEITAKKITATNELIIQSLETKNREPGDAKITAEYYSSILSNPAITFHTAGWFMDRMRVTGELDAENIVRIKRKVLGADKGGVNDLGLSVYGKSEFMGDVHLKTSNIVHTGGDPSGITTKPNLLVGGDIQTEGTFVDLTKNPIATWKGIIPAGSEVLIANPKEHYPIITIYSDGLQNASPYISIQRIKDSMNYPYPYHARAGFNIRNDSPSGEVWAGMVILW